MRAGNPPESPARTRKRTNTLRTLVATQLPSEGSVVPDDPITRHIVLKVFRGPAPPVRPLSPPRGDSRRANGPSRGAGRDRGAGRGTTRSSLISNNWGEGAVRRESVLVQHYHTPPGARHPQPVHHLGHPVEDFPRSLPVAPQFRADPSLSDGAVHPHPVPGCERSSPAASVIAPLLPHP